MPIVATQTLPDGTTREQIQAVAAKIVAGGAPTGCISHTIYEEGGKFRVVDVWASEADLNAFAQDRLIPTIVEMAQAMGMDPSQLPQAEPPSIYEAVDYFPQGQ
ncbi:MAG TPA: hypothetical protein VFW71_12565 [Actinomycetota bacterium]|nr:hypothetical protein [Actinomycetota bacterium]